ncbi:MAG: DUF2188 domain-containing protein [Caulobacteraceae bacterium]|nr:DUF2188 domain-containing protein [Caulobacteraceae bacterium]
MAKNSRHVAPSLDGRWSVRRTGAAKASKSFATQAAAVEYGTFAARKAKSDLYVHSSSGTVERRLSFRD